MTFEKVPIRMKDASQVENCCQKTGDSFKLVNNNWENKSVR